MSSTAQRRSSRVAASASSSSSSTKRKAANDSPQDKDDSDDDEEPVTKKKKSSSTPKKKSTTKKKASPKTTPTNNKSDDDDDGGESKAASSSAKPSKVATKQATITWMFGGGKEKKSTDDGTDDSKRPLFLFAPSAGANSKSPKMVSWAGMLGRLGDVTMFDYPANRQQARLIDAHIKELKALPNPDARPVFLIGMSMGSRMGCHVSTDEDVVARYHIKGVITLGYPLVGQNGQTRDAVLLEMTLPSLFISGTRDKMCPLDQMRGVMKKMTNTHSLYVVEGGDHGLSVLKKNGPQAKVNEAILAQIKAFINTHA